LITKRKRIIRGLGELPPDVWLTFRGKTILEKELQKLARLEQQVFPIDVKPLKRYRNITGYDIKPIISDKLPWC